MISASRIADSTNITGGIKGIVKVHLEASENKGAVPHSQVYIPPEFPPQTGRVQKPAPKLVVVGGRNGNTLILKCWLFNVRKFSSPVYECLLDFQSL